MVALEADGGGFDGEVEGVEDEEAGWAHDVDADLDRAREGAGDEVGLEGEVVAPGDGEGREAVLALELLHDVSS